MADADDDFLAAAAAMVPATAVHAEAYPSKTIRVVLPGPPGGLLDVAAELLGGLGSIQELCGAIGNPAYARLFAYFISDAAPVKLPGAHFVFASALMIACFAVSRRTFRAHEGEIVLPKFD